MIKILILVLSELSSGELTIGYEFGSRLSKDKYCVKYIIPEKFINYLKDKNQSYISLNINDGALINKNKVDQFIKKYKPDFMLISDVFTNEYSRIWSGISMKMLKNYNIPLIGVDEYQYLSTNYTPDYYGGIFEKLPPLLNECNYILRDCPINVNRIDQDKNIKCFSLYNQNLKLTETKKLSVRERLHINSNDKLIFYASSSWETINYNRIPSLGVFFKWIPKILQNYLNDLENKIALIHVGPNPWNEDQCKNFKYIHFNNLKPSDYDDYLLSSDLFITTNVVSVTLTKAVYGNVPSIVLQNYKYIDFKKLQLALQKRPEWYKKMAKELKCVFPFRAGFFGWYKLLEEVLKDNEYTNTFEVVQLFKYDEVITKLNTYLFNENEIHDLQERQSCYVTKILGLPSPEMIIDELVVNETRKKELCYV
ncbi:DUF6365 family protein [Clostridium butanoliproducens]|uniref:DUF6365 family protein n=1 Tax=Clostridium butanoliproducens TaxID=2991837 RepID=UPI0024B95E39|nr:DUF6365 family protein [Clostridium butanoliproducens]